MDGRLALLICFCLAACGTHKHQPDDMAASHGDLSVSLDMATPEDLSASPDLPPGDMATPFPAVEHPDVPQVITGGGTVMSAPKVVVVTFPNEALLTDIQTFVSTLGDQPYWSEATSEYGVGKITMLKSIQDPTTPSTQLGDSGIQSYLGSMLDGTHAAWPAPDGNTIYALFYPTTTTITITNGGQTMSSCSGFGGYHNNTTLASGQSVTYVVVPRCSDPQKSFLDTLTGSTSHELIESSEDPAPSSMTPGYASTDAPHVAWAVGLGGGETGDLCAQNSDAFFQPNGFAYYVQRNWSNKAAAAGLDPCVPADTNTIYANVTPTTPFDTVTFRTVPVDGYQVKVGVPRAIELELYSEAPLAAPAMVEALDLSNLGGTSKLAFSWDQTSGVNGDKLHLTVTASSTSLSKDGPAAIGITTTVNGVSRYWLTFIQAS